ncbi:MAG: ABC transporter ATP-binding protein [Pseudomonadota bacterium]
MSTPLQFNQLTMAYGDFKALDDFTLTLRQGEVLGLLGHNGAGKTTSMKLAMGVIAPTGGGVQVLGENPVGYASDRLRRSLGYLPENVSFYRQLTGREVLNYFARLKGVAVSEVGELLERVGLTAAAHKRIKTYSKGMRQRIGLAQALLGKPRLLLLDEPTAGLDPQVTREFYAMIDELRQQGVTILISSHVLPGVEAHIDRAAILGRGKLLAVGSLSELREQAQLPLTLHISGGLAEENIALSLKQFGFEIHDHNGKQFSLSGPEQNKLEALRLLLAQPEVSDLHIVEPSLESIYSYFNRPDYEAQL